jgi:hypothetical protein
MLPPKPFNVSIPVEQFWKNHLCRAVSKRCNLYNESNSEIRFLKDLTGKYPAVYGNDLINYTPSRVENGATTKATEDIRNGIKSATVW